MLPKKLQAKLNQRRTDKNFRTLGIRHNLIDFTSNDYLGFSMSRDIFDMTHHYLEKRFISQNGSRGSRLLSGNHELYDDVEDFICKTHQCESALIFNSGYDANLGFFSCVPQRGDVIFYDEFIHASIRDGIGMSLAKSYKFKHNDLGDLKEKTKRFSDVEDIYIVTESVFSMDGDSPDLKAFAQFCDDHRCYFVVDEAHAIGVFGKNGVGLVHELGIESSVFAGLITFGKALGCHGAAIFGSRELTDYLINFSRPFIFTTALPPHTLMTIKSAYKELTHTHEIEKLHHNIEFFRKQIQKFNLEANFIDSHSPIQCCVISGNEQVKTIALQLNQNGYDVKPILSPTVPKGTERLRFCLHSYNTNEEILDVLELLATFVKHEQ